MPTWTSFGKPLFEVVRFGPRTSASEHLTAPGSLNGARRVLYRLPRVLEAVERGEDVMVVEGRRTPRSRAARDSGDLQPRRRRQVAERVRASRCAAPTWRSSPIRDEPGPRARPPGAKPCRDGAEVDVVECANGKDISAHLAAGGDITGLVGISTVSSHMGSASRDEKKEEPWGSHVASPMRRSRPRCPKSSPACRRAEMALGRIPLARAR